MNLQNYVWGKFPEGHLRLFLKASEQAWGKASKWDNLQNNIEAELEILGRGSIIKPVQTNVPLSKLGVEGSQAEIDIVVHSKLDDKKDGLFLLHLSGHQTPRHEKELLEIMSVSLSSHDHCFGVLVVCTDNKLKLEGKAKSFDYCKGPLIKLAEPSLKSTPLKGLLIIGLPTPSGNKA